MDRRIDTRNIEDMPTSYQVLELVNTISQQNERIQELEHGISSLQLDSVDESNNRRN